jgi:hypothetical protein
MRIITLDIKDMYVNLPVEEIKKTIQFWLNKNNSNNKDKNEELMQLLNIIMNQNYFQYEEKIFQPQKGIAMGSPISGSMAEAYLQYTETMHVKHWLENGEILVYKRYVDDILIIYNKDKTDEQTLLAHVNKVDKNLQFKITKEENNTIQYLDISIYRNEKSIRISIYRKPTETGTVIHVSSNHPNEQKIMAFSYYINRMITLPITEEAKNKEWQIILAIAIRNGYIANKIQALKTKLLLRKQSRKQQLADTSTDK